MDKRVVKIELDAIPGWSINFVELRCGTGEIRVEYGLLPKEGRRISSGGLKRVRRVLAGSIINNVVKIR